MFSKARDIRVQMYAWLLIFSVGSVNFKVSEKTNPFPQGFMLKIMLCCGDRLRFPMNARHTFCNEQFKQSSISMIIIVQFGFNQIYSFFFKYIFHFLIGSYIKTMPGDGGHLRFKANAKKNQHNLLRIIKLLT